MKIEPRACDSATAGQTHLKEHCHWSVRKGKIAISRIAQGFLGLNGVTVPHGSAARVENLRVSQVYDNWLLNGRLVVNGQSSDTVSAAAN
jgi:hypothetical protein